MSYVCPFCDKIFKSAKYLSEHRIKIHGVKVRKKDNFKCMELDCSFKSGERQGLLQHLKVEHGIDHERKTLQFSQMKDFNLWKEKEEQMSSSHFVLGSGKNENESAKVFYFSCNRSGNYTASCEPDSRKRVLKTQGSIKINSKCTSYIKVSENCESKNLTVDYCPTHYGHQKTVAHIPMSSTTRLTLAGKLKCGVTPTRILQACHASTFDNQSNSICERNMLIGKKDLNNIKRQYNISGVSRHNEDHISVSMWVEELRSAGNCDIVVYKPVGETSERFPNLAKEDFLFIIQTEFQLQQYVAFGNEVVCVDSTHKTTQYEVKLTTVLCVDEWGEGVPVLWAISSKEDIPMVYAIFSVLKDRSPTTIPEYLMSDDAPVYAAAFNQVFSEDSTQKLLCSWHIERTWQRAITERIKDKTMQDEIYQELRAIAHTQNEQEFRELYDLFMKNLGRREATEEFKRYFSTEYGTRIHEWAAWARKHSLVNTNMYVESFHNVLKHGDNLQGKQNKRLDSLIDVLFKLESYYVEERVRKVEKGKVTKRIQGINARHRNSLIMKDEEYVVEKGVGDVWRFKNKNYCVMKRLCPRSVCRLECTLCKICIHAYTCSCPDMLYTKTICKHVHYIQRLISKKQPSSEVSEIIEKAEAVENQHDYANIDMPKPVAQNVAETRKSALQEILNSRKPQKDLSTVKEELLQLITNVSGLVNSCDDLGTLQEVKCRYVKKYNTEP